MRCPGMGRRKGWFSAVKKAFGSESKELGNRKSQKWKKKWFVKHQQPQVEDDSIAYGSRSIKEPDMSTTWTPAWCILEEPYAPPVIEQIKMTEGRSEDKGHAHFAASVSEDKGHPHSAESASEDKGHAHSAASASEEAAEDAEVSSQTSAEVVRLPNLTGFDGKLNEEVAAIKIQKAFRGRRAKRALRSLRGLVRLKSLVQGGSIKCQTASTLQCMQTLSHVQSQIRARRIRVSEENQALQRQLQQKHEKEMEKMKLTIDDWNGSTKSKEKLEENLRFRQEAAVRRERALAYAHSTRQKWKNASKTPNPTLMDEINPYWGWSWLDRWMAVRPWETSIESDNGGKTSGLSVAEISKAYYAHRERYPNDSNKPLPIPQRTSHISICHSSTSASKPAPAQSKATTLKSSSSKDSSNTNAVLSDKQTKQSVANKSSASKVKKSPSTAPSARNSTAPKVAQNARSRLQKSSSSAEKSSGAASRPVKKQLSSSPSPTPSGSRRHSGPPTINSSSIKNMNLNS